MDYTTVVEQGELCGLCNGWHPYTELISVGNGFYMCKLCEGECFNPSMEGGSAASLHVKDLRVLPIAGVPT